MTLDECRQHIGKDVVYHGWAGHEEGMITSVNDQYVFVRYSGDQHSKATYARDLTPATEGERDEDEPS